MTVVVLGRRLPQRPLGNRYCVRACHLSARLRRQRHAGRGPPREAWSEDAGRGQDDRDRRSPARCTSSASPSTTDIVTLDAARDGDLLLPRLSDAFEGHRRRAGQAAAVLGDPRRAGAATSPTRPSAPQGRRFVPIGVTLFLFILICNWIGFMPSALHPGVSAEILPAPTSDVNLPARDGAHGHRLGALRVVPRPRLRAATSSTTPSRTPH